MGTVIVSGIVLGLIFLWCGNQMFLERERFKTNFRILDSFFGFTLGAMLGFLLAMLLSNLHAISRNEYIEKIPLSGITTEDGNTYYLVSEGEYYAYFLFTKNKAITKQRIYYTEAPIFYISNMSKAELRIISNPYKNTFWNKFLFLDIPVPRRYEFHIPEGTLLITVQQDDSTME